MDRQKIVILAVVVVILGALAAGWLHANAGERVSRQFQTPAKYVYELMQQARGGHTVTEAELSSAMAKAKLEQTSRGDEMVMTMLQLYRPALEWPDGPGNRHFIEICSQPLSDTLYQDADAEKASNTCFEIKYR